jgi:hypothetical protein
MGTVFARYTLTESSAPLQLAVDGGFAMRSVDGQADRDTPAASAHRSAAVSAARTAPGDRGPLFSGRRLDGHRRRRVSRRRRTLSIWRTEATLACTRRPTCARSSP